MARDLEAAYWTWFVSRLSQGASIGRNPGKDRAASTHSIGTDLCAQPPILPSSMPAVFPNLAGRTLEVQRVKPALFLSRKPSGPCHPLPGQRAARFFRWLTVWY